MNRHTLQIVCFGACLAAATAFSASAHGQRPGGPPPGGPPPSGMGPGGPGPGPGGPGGPGPGPNGAPTPAPGSAGPGHAMNNGGLQLGPVGRWWDDKSVVQSIGINRDQQRKMDAIFNANKPAILSTYKAFLNEKAKLATISKDPNVDKARLFAAIDAVNQARAALQKATSETLLQIRAQMGSDQIMKLEKLR